MKKWMEISVAALAVAVVTGVSEVTVTSGVSAKTKIVKSETQTKTNKALADFAVWSLSDFDVIDSNFDFTGIAQNAEADNAMRNAANTISSAAQADQGVFSWSPDSRNWAYKVAGKTYGSYQVKGLKASSVTLGSNKKDLKSFDKTINTLSNKTNLADVEWDKQAKSITVDALVFFNRDAYYISESDPVFGSYATDENKSNLSVEKYRAIHLNYTFSSDRFNSVKGIEKVLNNGSLKHWVSGFSVNSTEIANSFAKVSYTDKYTDKVKVETVDLNGTN
jgi:hypothetical protein